MDAISYYNETDTDKPFLLRLFTRNRNHEFVQAGLTAQQIDHLLTQQFEAQHQQFRSQFGHAEFKIVTLNSQAVGRIYTNRDGGELRVIDISLLPEFCGRGLGTRILKQVIYEAQASGLPVRLHVLCNNPALRLYQRLGFVVRENKGVHLLMEKGINQ